MGAVLVPLPTLKLDLVYGDPSVAQNSAHYCHVHVWQIFQPPQRKKNTLKSYDAKKTGNANGQKIEL